MGFSGEFLCLSIIILYCRIGTGFHLFTGSLRGRTRHRSADFVHHIIRPSRPPRVQTTGAVDECHFVLRSFGSGIADVRPPA
jgi:hypothetical protein